MMIATANGNRMPSRKRILTYLRFSKLITLSLLRGAQDSSEKEKKEKEGTRIEIKNVPTTTS